MPRSPLGVAVRQLRAAGERDGAGGTDGELLTRFLTQRDADALAALVDRHAPMVWGVCRRVLRNDPDAEDAFQATFLVLVCKAGTVAPRERVANWLFGVARQTAVRLRATAARRGGRERQLADLPEPATSEARVSDLLPVLDQELSRLPDRFRVLIVLCDLEGKTRTEAARQLGCPEGTVASRLARARDLLTKRMARHGLAVSGGSLAAAVAPSAMSAGVPASVVASTIQIATRLATNPAAGGIAGPVAALTDGVLKAMLLKKILATTLVVLALGITVITGGRLAVGQTDGAGTPTDERRTEAVTRPAAAEPSDPPAAGARPMKAEPKSLTVVAQLLDDATGRPIARAAWQWGWANPAKRDQFIWGHRGGASSSPGGRHEMRFDPQPGVTLFRFHVAAPGYEPADVVEEVPDPLPATLERTVRVKPGRRVAGTLRDHQGRPVANGQVFFVPADGTGVRIVAGVANHASVSDVRTDAAGRFVLPTGGPGKLAASTEAVDLWPFPLPPAGAEAELAMPAPAHLALDLDDWYFDWNDRPGPPVDNPEECRILVRRLHDTPTGWEQLDYHRQMLVFAVDPKATLARGVSVAGRADTALAPIGGVGRHRHVQAAVTVALPPGHYTVQRTTSAGPVGNDAVTLTAGATTPLDWKRKFGAAVHGMVTLPANHQFIQQPGAAPRALDWTVPLWAYVHIDSADGKRRGGATIQPDGRFRIATHLEPGRYKLTTWIQVPPRDNRDRLGSDGGRPPDLDGESAFTIPEPPADPAGVLPVTVDLALTVHGDRIVPAPPVAEAPPAKPKPNYVTVVGHLLDAETGKPIEQAAWEHGLASLEKPSEIAWGHSWSLGGHHPGGRFEQVVNFSPDGRFDRLRVYAAGYEPAVVVEALPDPRPLQVERTVRLKRGRTVTGVLRDHTGRPVANGRVFVIPTGGRSNIVDGVTGVDPYARPQASRDAAVAEVGTDANGRFALPVGGGGTLAASTELVDLWPFPLPADGDAELKLPPPSYLVIDLTDWYLDDLAGRGKRALSPDSEDPNQCWLQVEREGSNDPLWKPAEYRRQMLVFATDPRAKLSRGVSVGPVIERQADKPIPGVGHNRSLSTTVRVALPPGSYRVRRLRAGPFAAVGERHVVLTAGEDTVVSWARGEGSAVRGQATWPADLMFVRQPGEPPRQLDWTVPDSATVWIAPAAGTRQPIEAAKVQRDGTFVVATHLAPGRYTASVAVYLPEGDFRGGFRLADCHSSRDFTVPEPARGPFGSPPVKVEIKLDVGPGGRFVAADPPRVPE